MRGRHWIALWTNGNVCEVLDSYALPLEVYQTAQPLQDWLDAHWKYVERNGQSLQSLYSQSCGDYALMYLIDRAEGRSMSQFEARFKKHDYVYNDHKVGQMLKQLISKERSWHKICKMEYHQDCEPSLCGLFSTPPETIHYCFGAWQDGFANMKKRGVKFHEGIPEEVDLTKWFPRGGVMVLDDLMEEGGNDKRVLDLFTKLSHHRNITVLYLCQDMFPPGKYAKSISRNAHYIVAFKNPRDQLGMRNLLLQAFPSRWQDVMDVYTKTTERPFGYMVLDLHPASGDDRRIFSHLLKGEGCMRCYRFVRDVRT
ncbi:hypothetical protein ACROYT_G033831 [Oculina patagonica]